MPSIPAQHSSPARASSALSPGVALPFRTTDALAAGVTPRALRDPRLHAPVPGVRMDARLRDDLPAVCAAVALVLPDDAAFSGPTAAALWRLPLARPVEAAALRRLHVVGRAGRRPVDVRRVVAHAGLRPGERTLRAGIPVTTPVRTWLDLGAVDLRDLGRPRHPSGVDARHEELVVVTDALLAQDGLRDALRYGLRPDDLAAALASANGMRGVLALRRALADARPFVDSGMETRTRLRLVASGLPCPVVGADLRSPGGAWIARPDLSWPEVRVGIEYDGEPHVDRRRLARDTARREAMEAAGWRVLVLYAEDVGLRWHATVRRLHDAFVRQGCADPTRLAPAGPTVERPVVVCRSWSAYGR